METTPKPPPPPVPSPGEEPFPSPPQPPGTPPTDPTPIPAPRRGRLLAAVLLLVAALPGSTAAQSRDDIAGVYRCTGTDPDGTDYHGFVVISRRGDAFQVQWSISSRLVAIGLGIVTGDVLAVSYYGAGPGVASYRIDGEQLIGTWTQPVAGGVLYRETLTRVHGGELLAPTPAPPANTLGV